MEEYAVSSYPLGVETSKLDQKAHPIACGQAERLKPRPHIREVSRCFMIEKVTTPDHIKEVCSIPEVDMVQFGSGDWGMNQGFGRTDRPEEWWTAEQKMIGCAIRHGVRPRYEVTSPEEAEYYKSLGVKISVSLMSC